MANKMINKYLMDEISKPKMKKLNTRLTEDMMHKIDLIKKEKGISKSKIIRLALIQYISNYQSSSAAPLLF